MPEIKVIIVEDEPLIAEDIAFTLKKNNFKVINIFYSFEDVIQEIETSFPDVILMDINLNGSTEGIELAKIIRNEFQIPVVYLTSYSDNRTIQEAKLTEPAGYVVKPFSEGGLCASLEVAVYNHQQKYINKQSCPGIKQINSKINNHLSEREFEVMKLLFEGYSNQKISESLFISMNTVKAHLKNAYLKLDVTSRSEAISKMLHL